MTWTARYLDEEEFVELAYTGETTSEDLLAPTVHCLEPAKASGTCRFLVEGSRMRLIASMGAIPRPLEELYVEPGADRDSWVAVVRPEDADSQDAVRFYEMVCDNRAGCLA